MLITTVSFLSFNGLNAATQTLVFAHHAPLNCQLVFHDPLKKRIKYKYTALKTSSQQNTHFLGTYFEMEANKSKTQPTKPRMPSPYSQVPEEETHSAQNIYF